jgi:hypothetical protein
MAGARGRGGGELHQRQALTSLVEEQGVGKPLDQDSKRLNAVAFVPGYKGKLMDPESQKLYDSLPTKEPDDTRVKVHIRYSRKEYISKDEQGVWGNWQHGFINACQDYVHLWAIPKDAVIRMRPVGRCTDDHEVILVEYR